MPLTKTKIGSEGGAGSSTTRGFIRSSAVDIQPFAYSEVTFLRNAMMFFLSASFLKPAKAMFVPGMNFLGFSRYVKRVSSLQVTPAAATDQADWGEI